MFSTRSPFHFASVFALLCLCVAWTAAPARAALDGAKGIDLNEPWRIRFLEAAVVQGDTVRLGEVAVPLGNMPVETWEELAKRELWPSPPEGRAMSMTRPRLQEAVMRHMKELSPYTLFPGSMALQRGGVLIGKEAIQHMVQSELAPYLASLPGETALTDFRLPQYVFMAHAGQQLVLEPLKKSGARSPESAAAGSGNGRNHQTKTHRLRVRGLLGQCAQFHSDPEP
jgi:flagella basal body P-ring formation protein FlgA